MFCSRDAHTGCCQDPKVMPYTCFTDRSFLSCGQNKTLGFKLWNLLQEPAAVRQLKCWKEGALQLPPACLSVRLCPGKQAAHLPLRADDSVALRSQTTIQRPVFVSMFTPFYKPSPLFLPHDRKQGTGECSQRMCPPLGSTWGSSLSSGGLACWLMSLTAVHLLIGL